MMEGINHHIFLYLTNGVMVVSQLKKNNLNELDTSVVKLHLENFKIHFRIILGLQYLRLV